MYMLYLYIPVWCRCAYMFICMCVHIWMCAHRYMCECACIYLCVHMYSCMCICIHVCVSINTYGHMCICSCVDTYMDMCISMHIYVHACMYPYMHICAYKDMWIYTLCMHVHAPRYMLLYAFISFIMTGSFFFHVSDWYSLETGTTSELSLWYADVGQVLPMALGETTAYVFMETSSL